MCQYSTISDKRRYLQCREIKTSDELWTFVKWCKENNDLVFRGVNEAKYMCFSSAQVRTGSSLQQDEYTRIINEAIHVIRKNPTLLRILKSRSNDDTDYQILALMQHYGCGTPILDYSNSIDSALFFATDRQGQPIQCPSLKDESVDAFISVYYFSKKDPNHCSVQEFTARDSVTANLYDAQAAIHYGKKYEGISEETLNSFEHLPYTEMAQLSNGGLFSVIGHSDGIIRYKVGGKGVEYDVDNERIEAQDGLFLFNGLSDKPYEMAAYDWYSGIQNYCVNIHKSLEGEIKRYLKKKGITCKTIYPQTEESEIITRELLNLPIDPRLKPKPVKCKRDKCSVKCFLKGVWKFCKYVFVPQRWPKEY